MSQGLKAKPDHLARNNQLQTAAVSDATGTIDNWRPNAVQASLHRRAALLQQIRQFFHERQVLEVETPLLSQHTVTDIHTPSFAVAIKHQPSHLTDNSSAISSDNSFNHSPTASSSAFSTSFASSDCAKHYYLQTSPEYAMKRLLAAGSGSIFQICKAFRLSEQGRYHNPEFTMLEWYRTQYDHYQLMDEVASLLQHVAGIHSIQRFSYQQLFQTYCGLDVFDSDLDELRQCISQLGLTMDSAGQLSFDDGLALLLTHVIEPALVEEGAVFIYDFPRSQAALAKICPTNPLIAHRFELYLAGIEIANGFHELTLMSEQHRRFVQDQVRRAQLKLPVPKIDHRLLAALAHGLPACAGVALGIDRLLMWLMKAEKIDDVLSFAWDRA